MKLAILALALALCAAAAHAQDGAVYGLDVSQPYTETTMHCLRNLNLTYVAAS